MPSQNRSLATGAPCRAFTLVELLVVIGIIALLISILLPALTKVQEQSRNLKCLANLRSIAQAAILHANDHRGFMPVAGATFSPTAPSATPAGMGDPNLQKYSYFSDGGQQRPMGLAGSFAKYVGQRVRTDSRVNLEADLNTGTMAKMFVCPSDRDGGWLGFTIAEYTGGLWTGPSSRQSYAFNEAVLGIAEPPEGGVSQPQCRLRGNLTRVKGSAQTFLMTDSTNLRGGSPTSPGIMVYYNTTFNQTLGDVYNFNGCGDPINFDSKRHRGRMNVNFFDGHAESVVIQPKALAKVYLDVGN
jgi:prepilin-type N-terminal cleavage/methylation domain-containing protein/prepilin-type processing-associated H-X9-DG protein